MTISTWSIVGLLQYICLSVLVTGGLYTASGSAYAAASESEAVVSALTASQKADRIITLAKSLKGKVSYQYGVRNPTKYIFDCSSFTQYLFASQGISIKWGSASQSKQGTYVAKKNLKKGDLVFFSVGTAGKVNHVGVYIGDGKFIHNTIGSSVNGVIISDINSANYSKRYITARRVIN